MINEATGNFINKSIQEVYFVKYQVVLQRAQLYDIKIRILYYEIGIFQKKFKQGGRRGGGVVDILF